MARVINVKTVQAKPSYLARKLPPKIAALRRFTLLVLLMMMTLSVNGPGVGFSTQAGAADVPKEVVRARSVYEHATDHQTKALSAKNGNNEKNLRFAEPTNEAEVKRLKLVFLLMMSLGQSRPGD